MTPSPGSEAARMGMAAAATAMTCGSLLKAIGSWPWRRSASVRPTVPQLKSVSTPVINAVSRALSGLPRQGTAPDPGITNGAGQLH